MRNFRTKFYRLDNSMDQGSSIAIKGHYDSFTADWIDCMSNFRQYRICKDSDVEYAVKSLMLAIHNSGAMFGLCFSRESSKSLAKKIISDNARNAAYKGHAENHSIKAYALKYYAENIDNFKSKDSAAEAIAGKIVTSKFRTVRQWITEYHKSLRSAGTT